MPHLRASTWLIALWTLGMTWLTIAMLSNPELRFLDIFVGALILGTWWFAGVSALVLVRMAADVVRWLQARRANRRVIRHA
jgi:hypothetical protein